MYQLTSKNRHHLAGFTLVEIMVAMAIGMFSVIVILQVLALSEQRKRTTTGAGDALTSGVMLFYNLKRDISMAGYGFSSKDVFGCPVKWDAGGTEIATAVRLAPVTINPGAAVIPLGDDDTDTLLIAFGSNNGQPQGSPINQAPDSTVLNGSVRSSFAAGDRVIAVPAGCSLDVHLNTVTAADDASVTVASDTNGSVLYNLGPAPVILAYAVRDSKLTVCNYLENDCGLDAGKNDPSIWVPIANNIVSLRVQYGRDADSPADGILSVYDQVTPTAGAAISGCDWSRIVAVRLALVARSNQFDKEEVTLAAPLWAGSDADNPAGSAATPIDLSGNAMWKNYRYRVFESVIPIRNVTWLGGAGC